MASPGSNGNLDDAHSGAEVKINEGDDDSQQEQPTARSSQKLNTEMDDEENNIKTKQIQQSPSMLAPSSSSSAPLRFPPIKVAPSKIEPASTKSFEEPSTDTSTFALFKKSTINPNIRKSIFKTATREREETRFAWETNFDFSMVSMACVIGINNFVRIPQLCKKYGGLSFFVPYVITVTFMGLPLYFLETLLGQYSGHGTVAVMNELVPAFVGIGYALVINNFVEFMRNEMVVARLAYMAISTMKTTIPWAVCDESNYIGCYTPADDIYCREYGKNYVFFNRTCTSISVICESLLGLNSTGEYCLLSNGSNMHYDHLLSRITPESEFHFRQILNLENASLSHLGPIHWPMFFCLALCWAMTYLLGYNGFSTTAKSSYLTTFTPLLAQSVLYVKAFSLTGAGEGIMTYLTFDATSLASKEVWVDAMKTCFSSLSLGLGLLTAISSASKPYKNCLKTSMAIIFMDTLISLLSGLGFFALMGNLAYSLETTVGDLLSGEEDVMFNALPMALTSLNFPRVYVAISYASTALMSFGYLAAVIGMTTYDGKDIFNSLTNQHGDKEKNASNLSIYQYNLVTCILGFTFSILFVAKGGTLVLEVTGVKGHVDMSFVIASLQTIVICFFYGSGAVLDLAEKEMGINLGRTRPYWALSWNIVAPMLLLWTAFNRDYTVESEDSDAWRIFGSALALYPFLVVLGFFVFQIYNYRKEGVWRALQPTRKWCLGLDTSLLIDAAEAEPDVWNYDVEVCIVPPPSQPAIPPDMPVLMAPSAGRVGPAPAREESHMQRLAIAASGAPSSLVPQEMRRSKSIFEGRTAMAILNHTLRSHSYVPFERQMEAGKRLRRLSERPP